MTKDYIRTACSKG